MKRTALALALSLLPAATLAQQFPTTLGQNTVYGRLGIGAGPGQAIPITTLLSQGLGAQNANIVYAGPSSGSAALPAFRSLVGADLPVPSASTLGGVKSLTCSSSNWFNTISTAGAPGCTQPNFTDLAGSIAAGQIPAGTITNAMLAGSAAIALSKLATQTANTVVANVSGSTASPTAASLPSCSGSTNALNYTSGTGFGCDTFGTVVSQAYNATTWTPSITCGTGSLSAYTTQVGSYEQIGRHVTARFTVTINGLGNCSGALTLAGLPVTVANTASDTGMCSLISTTAVTLDTSYTQIYALPVINTTTATLQEWGSGQTINTVRSGMLTGTASLVGFCEYHS